MEWRMRWFGLIAAGLWLLTSSNAIAAACAGRDLWPSSVDEKPKAEPETVFASGRLFAIEAPGGAVSFLLPTLHASDPRVLRISETQSKALAKARLIAVESLEIDRHDKPATSLPDY